MKNLYLKIKTFFVNLINKFKSEKTEVIADIKENVSDVKEVATEIKDDVNQLKSE